MQSSQVKHIYLFCRQDLSTYSPFDPFIVSLHIVYPIWNISQHTFVSNKLGEYFSCCRLFLYMSSNPLPSSSLFSNSSAHEFPKFSCWFSPIFNILPFSLFTNKNHSSLPSSLPTNTYFHEPNVLAFSRDDTSTSFNFAHAIVYSSHPVPEPNLSLSEGVFNGWFGIPFQDTLYFTHIHLPHLSEISSLYGLSVFIPFYPTVLSSIHIQSLVIHVPLLRVIKHISRTFLFYIAPPPPLIYSSPTHQFIKNCFTLQPLPVKDPCDFDYQADPDTKVLIDRLSINASLDEPTILKLPTTYSTTTVGNLSGSPEGRLVYYEPIPIVTKHICSIVDPTSLRHTIFNLMYAIPVAGYMGEHKILYRIRLRLFWPRLRSNVSELIKKCPHCMITYRWQRRGQ